MDSDKEKGENKDGISGKEDGVNRWDIAHQVAINATEAYPRSAELWIIHIDLAKVDEGKHAVLLVEGQDDWLPCIDKAKLFKKALDRCPESYSLWDSYNDWINKQHEEKAMSIEETDQVYTVSQLTLIAKDKDG